MAIEHQCQGCGGQHCAWEIRPIDQWGREADLWRAAQLNNQESISAALERKMADLHQEMERRQKMEKQLRQQAEQLAKTQQKLLHTAKLASSATLSASIAHEFGSPIFGIRNILQGLVASDQLSSQEKEMLRLGLDECQRLQKLLANLKELRHSSQGGRSPVSIHRLLDEILLQRHHSHLQKEINVHRNYDQKELRIPGVRQQLKEVFLTLLDKAEESIGHSGIIAINSEKTSEGVLISMRDNGRNLATGALEETGGMPFPSSEHGLEGTGFGLPVSSTIIQQHGGWIDAEKQAEDGWLFRIFLPSQG